MLPPTLASHLPPATKTTARTRLRGPTRLCRTLPPATSHNSTSPPVSPCPPPDARVCPSGEKARPKTGWEGGRQVARSFPVAAYLAYALRHVEKRAYLIDGVAGMLGEQASIVEAEDLMIAISFHPYARETAEVVAGARERRARVIAISDSRLSPIAREADLCFEIKDAEVRQFRPLTASLCLAQTLAISYAYRLGAGRARGH